MKGLRTPSPYSVLAQPATPDHQQGNVTVGLCQAKHLPRLVELRLNWDAWVPSFLQSVREQELSARPFQQTQMQTAFQAYNYSNQVFYTNKILVMHQIRNKGLN